MRLEACERAPGEGPAPFFTLATRARHPAAARRRVPDAGAAESPAGGREVG